jgi:acylpyruvate hydrolase
MKLLTFRKHGENIARVGCLNAKGRIVDLALAYASFLREMGKPNPLQLAHESIPVDMIDFINGGEASLKAAEAALAYVEAEENRRNLLKIDSKKLLIPTEEIEFLPPITHPGKIICAGGNYREHLAETEGLIKDSNRRKMPIAFLKASSALLGHRGMILFTEMTPTLDYEIELAFVIGKKGKCIKREEVLNYIYGYTIFNDVSERHLALQEFQHGSMLGGKSMDTFAPMGPWIVTKDEIKDPQNLNMILRVNGEIRQNSNTQYMIFDIFDQVAYWSSMLTIYPGDVFTTGTPSGVAFARKPSPEPYYLKPGDIVEAEIEGLGILINKVVKKD